MVKVIDRRKIAMGGNNKRVIGKIKNIAVHYSATETGNTSIFENHWKNTRKWVTGGYHEVVLTNGDVELNYDPTAISNGVGGQNTSMYNICYVGAGKPNDKQIQSLIERVNYNRNRLNVLVSNVKGHREFSGQSTSCPSLNMDEFRKMLVGKEAEYTPPKKQTASTTVNTPNLKVDGFMGPLTIMALQRYFGTVIDGIISKPSLVIKALQKLVRTKQDGYLGPITIRAMQKRFGTIQDGKLSKPSLVIKELQRRLNKGKL